jgi:hypothetical protein
VRRVWLRVALAAGAGLAWLVVCYGACVAIVLLFFLWGEYVVIASLRGRLDTPLFLFGVGTALILALTSLSLPARALGATKDHVTNTAVLSGLGFCAFVYFVVVSLGNPSAVPIALLALVATSVIGSLVAIHQEEGHITVRLGRATVIAAVAIYCASLLANWLVHGEWNLLYYLVPLIVASCWWLVVPGIVASLRSD